ncbi:MAG: LysR substrate-binding domain-containing protein [Alsobacter sp.]
MDLRQFSYFRAVARHRSISAAASELGVAQPTLTKSIRALELELDVVLFHRLPRGVELTPSGASFLTHVEAVQVQIRDARREIESLRQGTIGSVNIGAGPAWLRRHLPQAVARSIARHPGLRVAVQSGFDDVLLRDLRQGTLDFVVAELPSPDKSQDLELTLLSSDELRVCCRARHPLARARGVAMSDLLAYPWIMPPHGTRAQTRLSALFTSANLPAPEPAVESESLAFLLQIIRDSDALSFTVSTTLLPPEGRGLTLLDVPGLSALREAGVIRRRGAWLSPAAAAVIGELRAVCELMPRN